MFRGNIFLSSNVLYFQGPVCGLLEVKIYLKVKEGEDDLQDWIYSWKRCVICEHCTDMFTVNIPPISHIRKLFINILIIIYCKHVPATITFPTNHAIAV